MWCNHSFSQRNKTTERAVGVGIGGDREGRVRGWINFKEGLGGRKYRVSS